MIEEKLLELNINLKRLLDAWNVPDLEGDKLVFEIMKFNKRELTTLIQQEREKVLREFVALIASPEYPSDWEVPNGAILARMEQYLSQQPKDYTKAIDEKFNNPLEQLDNIVDETFNPKEQNK